MESDCESDEDMSVLPPAKENPQTAKEVPMDVEEGPSNFEGAYEEPLDWVSDYDLTDEYINTSNHSLDIYPSLELP